MARMVEDLLVLARHDQHPHARRDAVDLADLARQVVADVTVAAPSHPIAVDAPTEVLLLGDEGHLRQVVLNLVVNAVTHTPHGSAVEVAVAVTADDGAVELRVADHGAGIAPDDRERVFERFVRLDGSRTRASGGSGLGLAIVRSMVEAHVGAIRIEDTAGGGATFVVRLPLSPVDDDDRALADAP